MKAEQKKVQDDRPLLTVVKSPKLLELKTGTGREEKSAIARPISGVIMPEQPSGYIKAKTHDCL